ncbi:DUF5359 family protein [Aquibacillus salsiterrae]|uniref:YpfB family protein n=1 Tax=Aquibacillus salsiterrae TaxID=2950439 RepID=A0A9X3WCH3_9BACI|nr:DUF5359 family protein [Aquibacillus salsiterrae]MDC3415395.1 YpfB family protein [Aquibacillus salsiterrae]
MDMKRVERIIIAALCSHLLLLIIFQVLINQTDIKLYVEPVYQYLGVFKDYDSNHIKTLDYLFNNVLSF